MSTKPTPVKFPQDELAHKMGIEWWYWNGHLKDSEGNPYTFMDCLFKANPKKATVPIFKHLPIKDHYFAHSILSDIKNQKSYPVTEYISIISKDSFSKSLLFVNYAKPLVSSKYINNLMEEPTPFEYHVKNSQIDLYLKSTKTPLLEGGNGFVDNCGDTTYYYSLTNLETEGEITVNGKKISVKGKSWMDHQWANTRYDKGSWFWFSLQLDNNVELVCYEYGNKNGKHYQASMIDDQNAQLHTNKVKLSPKSEPWISAKTKANYTLDWQIEIPDFDLIIDVHPLIKEQEMLFGMINYWEGPLAVSGQFHQKPIFGQGFLELVGCPMIFNDIGMAKKEITKSVNDVVKRASDFKKSFNIGRPKF